MGAILDWIRDRPKIRPREVKRSQDQLIESLGSNTNQTAQAPKQVPAKTQPILPLIRPKPEPLPELEPIPDESQKERLKEELKRQEETQQKIEEKGDASLQAFVEEKAKQLQKDEPEPELTMDEMMENVPKENRPRVQRGMKKWYDKFTEAVQK